MKKLYFIILIIIATVHWLEVPIQIIRVSQPIGFGYIPIKN